MKSHMLCGLLILGAGTPVRADDCAFKGPREAVVDAGGVRNVQVDAGAGSLRIEGHPGLADVRSHGTACASNQRRLDEIELVAERRGDTLHIETRLPESAAFFDIGRAWLDLVVELPDTLPLEVKDGSGSVEIRDVAATRVHDGSGELTIERVKGDLAVRDGSGSIRVAGVTGNVWLDDGSGEIMLRDVGGTVVVEEDGSGGFTAEGVKGSVLVRHDGSGGIDVRDVSGDFTVDRDGSGSISHRHVKGRVQVPSRK